MAVLTKGALIEALSSFEDDAPVEICTLKKLLGCDSYAYYDVVNIEREYSGADKENPMLIIKKRHV